MIDDDVPVTRRELREVAKLTSELAQFVWVLNRALFGIVEPPNLQEVPEGRGIVDLAYYLQRDLPPMRDRLLSIANGGEVENNDG